ncbi:SDR family oxidoreductase [Candidatus Persebacteraceae bacterium Df01]|jgi:enoyl-[acyl-carrier protein] reductase I|uniref:Enoyl-[acyl-carrier-protein] reductase [NADH] n=1 Tax=Candidatus Doriopsillibacter californiensis TaxID=2970740 RepID=A0ABT7QMD1_9GAMM|nr:SDR family oxidoreductase [Candidatus Persebacteraceae bacterium Df01]
MLSLTDKKILITGVRNRRSLAYFIAARAAAEGAQLVFAVQPDNRGDDNKAAALVATDFNNAPALFCDAGDDDSVTATVNSASEILGGLDGLVHAIAFARRETIAGAYQDSIDRASFTEALDISAYTLTAFAKAALPHFGDGGSLVTLSYLGAERALPNYNVMGVAKAALEASVRYLALGLGANNVRVNAVSAGPVKTLSAAGIDGFGKILKQVEKQAPLKRNVSAEEIANAAVFLLSEQAAAITGEVLHVDAGFHITAGFEFEEENK